LFSKNIKLHAIPFILNGIINIYFILSDFIALHHDMLLSSMVFIIYGLFLFYSESKRRIVILRYLLAVVSATYLLSGIVKMDGGFLSGEMAETIILRAEVFYYWPYMEYLRTYSELFSWVAMLVEVIEPLVLIFTVGIYKFYTVLVAFPFHLGILLTGTGTVYNLIYPASFILLLNNGSIYNISSFKYIKFIYRIVLLVFISFSSVYILMLIKLSIKNLLLYFGGIS
jgi:hypothetical protein